MHRDQSRQLARKQDFLVSFLEKAVSYHIKTWYHLIVLLASKRTLTFLLLYVTESGSKALIFQRTPHSLSDQYLDIVHSRACEY